MIFLRIPFVVYVPEMRSWQVVLLLLAVCYGTMGDDTLDEIIQKADVSWIFVSLFNFVLIQRDGVYTGFVLLYGCNKK